MLSKNDLARILEDSNKDALHAYGEGKPAGEFIIRTTSGTSGTAPLVKIGPFFRGAHRFGERRRVLILAGSRSVRLSNVRFALEGGSTALALSFDDIERPLEALLGAFSADCVVGLPSFIAALVHVVGPAPFRGVKHLALIGELCPAGVREEFSAVFPGADISLEYISSEIGKMGDSCPYLPLNQYHPRVDTTVEILSPDGEAVGEILVSRPIALNYVVERYRTGDAGRMSTVPCPCGSPVTFEVLGRIGYDYLKVSGAQLCVEEFERVAQELEMYLADFRAEAGLVREGGAQYGSIRLLVLPRGMLLHDPVIRAVFAREFEKRLYVTATKTLAELIALRLFLPLEVDLVDTPFPLESKTMKLRSRV